MDYRFCPQCAAPLESRPLDGLPRLVCPAPDCGFVFWNNPVPVVAGLVEHGENVLLIQNKGWPEGWWGLVSGFLERGETPEEGMLREVREELGLAAELAGLIGVYGFPARNQVIMSYHLRAEGPYQAGPELAGVKAVPTARLKGWESATGRAVSDWLRGREALRAGRARS
jgi:ADP-ribose pyrophosphatase YjhB (NUDIX family)